MGNAFVLLIGVMGRRGRRGRREGEFDDNCRTFKFFCIFAASYTQCDGTVADG